MRKAGRTISRCYTTPRVVPLGEGGGRPGPRGTSRSRLGKPTRASATTIAVTLVREFNRSTMRNQALPLVAVKSKFQIVIPQSVREQVGVQVGDLLEARVERGRITFTPKSVVDRGIAESIADFKAGRAYGPFKTHTELIASLHAEALKLRVSKKPKRASRA